MDLLTMYVHSYCREYKRYRHNQITVKGMIQTTVIK